MRVLIEHIACKGSLSRLKPSVRLSPELNNIVILFYNNLSLSFYKECIFVSLLRLVFTLGIDEEI
jgi:hypothetical protein